MILSLERLVNSDAVTADQNCLCELSDESSHGTLTNSSIMLNLTFSTSEKNKTVLIPMTITVEVVHEVYVTHFLSIR